MKVKVAVLYLDGINRDYETTYAFEKVGAVAEVVHVNSLINKDVKLKDFQIVVMPGGFSFGDDIMSAKVWANKILYRLKDEFQEFVQKDKLVLGICNGFQALVRIGLLPFNKIGNIDAALIHNDSGKFESRWVKLKIEESNCVFTKGMEGKVIEVPVSHGEGKFIADEKVLDKIEDENKVVFRYVDKRGRATQEYPENCNGALRAIAGICDESGKIMGLMPHPECYVNETQHPNWTFLSKGKEPDALPIFQNAVNYFK